jgi:DNA-binding NarL/FixJ family response regulator
MVPEPAGGMPEPVIRVLVVDDHPLVREGIRFCLQSQPDLEVAGEAEGCDQALALLDQERVDVALLDMRMPGIGGVEATRMIRAAHPTVRVLILTAYPEYASEAFQAGASGYVLKMARSQGLLAAIRSVYCGATVIQESLMESLGLTAAKPPAEDAGRLSRRELDVLRLLARGLTNRAIARELRIGPRTADQHVHSIFIKTGVKSRTAAVRYALERNLATGEREST